MPLSRHASPVTGEFALLIVMVVSFRNYGLLTQAIKAIARECNDQQAKWILQTAKQDLTPCDRDWLSGNLEKMWEDPTNKHRRPHSSYHWKPIGAEKLSSVAHVRLTEGEVRLLEAEAARSHLSKSDVIRGILREHLFCDRT